MSISINIVPDKYGACPVCGAYWGHPDSALDFPNRQKVDNHWRCYNPDCICGYYDPDLKLCVENKPTPEKAAEIAAKVKADIDDLMERSRWISQGNCSRCIPKDAPLPDGWKEGTGDLDW